MGTYVFFSLKVLPTSGKRTELIGREGYKNIFDKFLLRIRQAHRARDTEALLEVSFPLRNDFYLSALHVHPDIPYAHGKFLKFDKPAALVDTLTGDKLQAVPKNASAHRYEIRYVFDYTRHVLAVQMISGKTPNVNKLIEAISFLFNPIVNEFYKEYYLTVDLLTSDEELNRILKNARAFKRVQVDLTVTNSDEYLDDEVAETEKEIAEKGIAEISHTESASKAGFMNDISRRCRVYLRLARKNGNATIRYLEKQSNKVRTFVMKDHPIRTTVPITKNMNEGKYLDGVHSALINADDKTRS